MSDRDTDMRKVLASIPDELYEWLDKHVKEKYKGIRGGKSMAVTNALELLREKEK